MTTLKRVCSSRGRKVLRGIFILCYQPFSHQQHLLILVLFLKDFFHYLCHSSLPAKPKPAFHLLPTFNQTPLSVPCPCYDSKVTRSIISSLIQSNLPFYAPIPMVSASNMSWGKQRRMCASVCMCECICASMCVKEL